MAAPICANDDPRQGEASRFQTEYDNGMKTDCFFSGSRTPGRMPPARQFSRPRPHFHRSENMGAFLHFLLIGSATIEVEMSTSKCTSTQKTGRRQTSWFRT
jgi:hypothetical protein